MFATYLFSYSAACIFFIIMFFQPFVFVSSCFTLIFHILICTRTHISIVQVMRLYFPFCLLVACSHSFFFILILQYLLCWGLNLIEFLFSLVLNFSPLFLMSDTSNSFIIRFQISGLRWRNVYLWQLLRVAYVYQLWLVHPEWLSFPLLLSLRINCSLFYWCLHQLFGGIFAFILYDSI